MSQKDVERLKGGGKEHWERKGKEKGRGQEKRELQIALQGTNTWL